MSLAELRDLFIVIISVAGIAAIILFSVIVLLIYLRIRSILDSSRATVANIREFTAVMSKDVAKPLSNIASVLQGITRVIEFITGPARRKEERRGGRER